MVPIPTLLPIIQWLPLPVTLKEPVNDCMSVNWEPNILLPLEYTIDEVTCWTTSFCAVIVPVNKAFDPVISPVIDIDPVFVNTFCHPTMLPLLYKYNPSLALPVK